MWTIASILLRSPALHDEAANPFVAGLVGTTNLLPARVRALEGDTLTPGIGDVRFPLRAAGSASSRLTVGWGATPILSGGHPD